MDLVRKFEKSRSQGRRSIAKDAEKYAHEFGVQLVLKHPLSKAVRSETKEEIPNERVSKVIENTMNNIRMKTIKGQKKKVVRKVCRDEMVRGGCRGLFQWVT